MDPKVCTGQYMPYIAAAVEQVRGAPPSPLVAQLRPLLGPIDPATLDGATLRG